MQSIELCAQLDITLRIIGGLEYLFLYLTDTESYLILCENRGFFFRDFFFFLSWYALREEVRQTRDPSESISLVTRVGYTAKETREDEENSEHEK